MLPIQLVLSQLFTQSIRLVKLKRMLKWATMPIGFFHLVLPVLFSVLPPMVTRFCTHSVLKWQSSHQVVASVLNLAQLPSSFLALVSAGRFLQHTAKWEQPLVLPSLKVLVESIGNFSAKQLRVGYSHLWWLVEPRLFYLLKEHTHR